MPIYSVHSFYTHIMSDNNNNITFSNNVEISYCQLYSNTCINYLWSYEGLTNHMNQVGILSCPLTNNNAITVHSNFGEFVSHG